MNPAAERELVESFEESVPAHELRSNFIRFSVQFAILHGVATAPLAYATSTLQNDVGYLGNALLNVFTILSTFSLGPAVVAATGLMPSILTGMSLFCTYVALFGFAIWAGTHGPPALQRSSFCTASCIGGAAAGILWTAQGAYFGRTVDLVARKEGREGSERSTLTSSLAGTFAFYFLGGEVLMRLLWAGLGFVGLEAWHTAAAFTFIGSLSTTLMARALSLSSSNQKSLWSARAQAAVKLWQDPAVFMLAGVNLTFGFSAAFMTGHVNSEYITKKQFSDPTTAVPMFVSVIAVVAALMSKMFDYLAVRAGKGFVITVGSASFLCIASLFMFNEVEDWKWRLLALYMLQGVGRAVYESTSKSVFADFFPHNSVGAFSNVMLQTSIGYATCYFLNGVADGRQLAGIIMGLALLTPLGFAGAERMRANHPGERTPMLAPGN